MAFWTHTENFPTDIWSSLKCNWDESYVYAGEDKIL